MVTSGYDVTIDPGEFVHEYNRRWIVAEYREGDGRYYAPQRKDVRKLTGCTVTYGDLSYVAGDAYNYKHRKDALRKARELYG